MLRIIAIFTAVLSVCTASPLSAQEKKQEASAKWESEIAGIEKRNKEKPAPQQGIVFAGSSSIRLWKLEESFPGLPVVNCGFGGSQIADSTHFAERIILPLRPRVIIFYAGDNDIQGGLSAERVAADFEAFVAKVHAKLPETKIMWLPVKPSIARWKLIEAQRDANARVAAFCAKDAARLKALATDTPLLGSDGKPKPEYFVKDGLHLSAEGYKVWNKIVLDALTAWNEVPARR